MMKLTREEYDELWGETVHHRYVGLMKDGEYISREEFQNLLLSYALDSIYINDLYKKANKMKIKVLEAYFLHDIALADIGRKYGFSRERARQILNNGIDGLGCDKVYIRNGVIQNEMCG